ncbi:hypothetical protein M758_8G062700 [Ceratodon purpureus]|nr:hypothetical protein M758_8G062700 [Ceratodon purpureus]
MYSLPRRALGRRAWRSVVGGRGATVEVSRSLSSAAASSLIPREQCSGFSSCDRGCCNAQSGDLSKHAFTNSRFSFNQVRNISGACTGRNVTADPIYDKLRHASTRHESTAAAEDAPVEKYEYQAEVSRLLDLIVNSLYSNKEVFLRELVSNASDALDKLRFLSVTDTSLLDANPNLEIRIKADRDAGTLTITDSGVGMTREELIESLGTIAHSGTAKFLKALKENQGSNKENNLIGQFGVGFYSAFLVADKVSVSTKSAKSDKQFVWEGEADTSSYTIREETDSDKLIPRGTSITLHLKDAHKFEYSDPTKIEDLIKNYSQFISFPIYTWQEKTQSKKVQQSESDDEVEKTEQDKNKSMEKSWDWELTNDTKPIWMRSPKEVTPEEYNAFYKSTFKEYMDPQAYTHFSAEGEIEFKSLLFIPPMAPLNTEEMWHARKGDVRLYVKRVFISDQFNGELFPRYLSFMKGIVDSNDLPLNVSREILQQSRIVKMMRQRLVRKTFEMIEKIAKDEDKEAYPKFWDVFGKNLKLGCTEDSPNHKRIAPLLRFYSSKSEDTLMSLDEYVERMKETQKEIYFLAAESIKSAKNAPFVEDLLNRDLEVLYLVDPIDEVALSTLSKYKEKKFVDISKEDLDLGGEDKEKDGEIEKEYQGLCDWLSKSLGEKVAKVQVSKRRTSSPCVLVSAKYGWSANMEKIMKAQSFGDESKAFSQLLRRRTLEINPHHQIIKDLNTMFNDETSSTEAEKLADLLFETSNLSSGFTVSFHILILQHSHAALSM